MIGDSFYFRLHNTLSAYDMTFASLLYAWLRRTGIKLVCITKFFSFTRLTEDYGVPSVICKKSMNYSLNLRALPSTLGTSC